MVEEYTRFAKKFLQNAIKATVCIHVLLFFVDGMPFTACLVGGLSQIAYSRLLKRYPFIEVQTMEFMGSVVMLILTHVYWMRYFREERYSTEYAMGFFLCTTWLVPFGFFISLAANESVLPGGTSVIDDQITRWISSQSDRIRSEHESLTSSGSLCDDEMHGASRDPLHAGIPAQKNTMAFEFRRSGTGAGFKQWSARFTGSGKKKAPKTLQEGFSGLLWSFAGFY